MYKKKCEILIRDFKEEDIENKIKWINDINNNEYLHYCIPLNYDDTKKWFINKDNSTRIDCVIEYLEIPVGLIGLLNIDKINSKAEFYISMGDTNYKRKGIGYNSSKILLEYAFNDLKLNKVYLNVDADNVAACLLYEKLGFKVEGYFTEDLCHKGKFIDRKRYAILKKDFERKE